MLKNIIKSFTENSKLRKVFSNIKDILIYLLAIYCVIVVIGMFSFLFEMI